MISNASLPSTHLSLLGRLRFASDQASWELFVRTYGMFLYQFCTRRGLQDSDAVDVVQEVLAQVVVSIPKFEYDPARGRFRDWLGAIARSKLARHWRVAANPDHHTSHHDPDQIGSSGFDPEWSSDFDAYLVQTALSSIRDGFCPTNWQAFVRTWQNGEPAVEVGKSLGIPLAQVYVAKSRISKRLAEEVRFLSEDIPRLATST